MFLIRVGSINIARGQTYMVDRIVINDEFDKYSHTECDIALMKIKGPIVMSPNVVPVCLPEQSYAEPKGMVTVTGWGSVRYKARDTSERLRQIELDIYPIEQCAMKYTGFNYKIYKSQFCIWSANKDACTVYNFLN